MGNVFDLISNIDLEGLKKYLEENPKGLEVQNEDGVWALDEVMRQGDINIVRYVVEYSFVNMNLVDRKGNTILHYAVESGNPELVKYVSERIGCSIKQANYNGETPVDKAISLEMTDIVSYFEGQLGASYSEFYHNPVCEGMSPDPSIVRVGEDYYMVNSSFHFFPAIPISHSKDLIHWEVIGHAITNPEWARLEGLEGGRGYWAPDISYNEGRFYITATYRLNDGGIPKRQQMVTSSDKPEGPYCEPVFLDEEGIDPSIFTDVDGRRYMLLNRGARIFEISKDGTRIISEPRLLWYGDNKKSSEGPHLLYKDGYYYLFMAEGGTGMGHRVSVARSKTLMGVYESCPYNPILRQWDEDRRLQCCGHGKPVQTKEGDWYLVYLCNRKSESGYYTLGRETSLDPITWTEDGWPIVNHLQGPSDIQRKPFIKASEYDYAIAPKILNTDKGIWNDWFTVRGCEKSFAYLDGESICIKGNGKDLNIVGYNSVLLKHQKRFEFTMSCDIDVTKIQGEIWDCGLTCYYDENSYLKLGLCKKGDIYGILAVEYVSDGYVSEEIIPIDKTILRCHVEIETYDTKRILYATVPGGNRKQIALYENTSYLSSEGLKKGKRFTGACMGMYVNGNGIGEFGNFETSSF